MFQLAYSLPYWAWRTSEQPVPDRRRNRVKEPLRGYRDVSLLDSGREPLHSFLYEAQVTCVITGLVDGDTWTAYCFDDSGHDGIFALNAHQHSKDVKAGINTDPISFGVIDADKPIDRPFEYFIRVLVIRLKLLKDEWRTTIWRVTRSIRRYESVSLCHPFSSELNVSFKYDYFGRILLQIDASHARMLCFTPEEESRLNRDAGALSPIPGPFTLRNGR